MDKCEVLAIAMREARELLRHADGDDVERARDILRDGITIYALGVRDIREMESIARDACLALGYMEIVE
jgi:hypothetical protein